MPDTAEYLARIRSYSQGREVLELLERTPVELAHLLANATAEQIGTRPSPGKWSVGEIVAHLAEDEIATAWRYRQMLEHDGIALAGFDQDLWAHAGDYESRILRESLELFRLLRGVNLQLLRQLTPAQWKCSGIHAERGRITVRDLAAHMAGHDANHLDQIRCLLS